MNAVPFDGVLTVGGQPFRFGGVRFGMFDEATALETKRRFHELSDGTGFSGRVEKTVPFGCEYAIVRTYERFPGVLRVAADVRALYGGAVAECALDPLSVPENVVRAGVLRDDGTTEWTSRASGAVMPRALELELADGTFAELQTGDDLWRHRSAAALGAQSAWEMTLDGGRFDFARTMVKFPADVPPADRPWRWEYALVWARPGTEGMASDAETADCAGLCFAAPAVRRKFRDLVRRASRSIRLVNVAPGICADGGHVGRGGRELAHQDAGELLALFAWANRQLAPRGLEFTAELTAEAAAARPALAARLAQGLTVGE